MGKDTKERVQETKEKEKGSNQAKEGKTIRHMGKDTVTLSSTNTAKAKESMAAIHFDDKQKKVTDTTTRAKDTHRKVMANKDNRTIAKDNDSTMYGSARSVATQDTFNPTAEHTATGETLPDPTAKSHLGTQAPGISNSKHHGFNLLMDKQPYLPRHNYISTQAAPSTISVRTGLIIRTITSTIASMEQHKADES